MTLLGDELRRHFDTAISIADYTDGEREGLTEPLPALAGFGLEDSGLRPFCDFAIERLLAWAHDPKTEPRTTCLALVLVSGFEWLMQHPDATAAEFDEFKRSTPINAEFVREMRRRARGRAVTSPPTGRQDPEHVAVIREYLADHLRAESADPHLPGTSAPLKQAADEVELLPLTDPLLCGLTAQATPRGDDLDDFYWGPGWSLISKFDPRTTSLRSLLGAIFEWNHDDEIVELDESI